MNTRGVRIVLKWAAILVILFALAPFFSLLMGQRLRDGAFREIAYRTVFERITTGCADDSATVEKLFDFVHASVKGPEPGTTTKDTDPLSVLFDGRGSCDQQANLLITFAAMGGIHGKLVYLRGDDSVSHHSICTLSINGRLVALDAFTGQRFTNEQGAFRSIADVQHLPADELRTMSSNGVDYSRLFAATYPHHVALSNDVSPSRAFGRAIVRSWCATFGWLLLPVFLKAYVTSSGASPERSARIGRSLH